VLQRLGDRALMFRRKMGVFTRQNLAGIGDEVTHDVGRREWNLVRCQRLGGGLGGAHIDKRR